MVIIKPANASRLKQPNMIFTEKRSSNAPHKRLEIKPLRPKVKIPNALCPFILSHGGRMELM